jgi:hypothetical protein
MIGMMGDDLVHMEEKKKNHVAWWSWLRVFHAAL